MEDVKQMIKDCEDRESRLSDWELSFVDSIKDQVYSGKSLSHKQTACLEKIWDNATSNG